MKEILLSLQKMDALWHRIVGIDGSYYIGNREYDFLITFLTFKRICDICKEQYERVCDDGDGIDFKLYSECYRTGCLRYDYREKWSWNYVISQENLVTALDEAVRGINYSNYINIGYGDRLIPAFHFPNESVDLLDQILAAWVEVLDQEKLGMNEISEGNWLELSTIIRKNQVR